MSYIKKTLLPDEKIVYYTGPHYVVFMPCFLWLIIAALVFFIFPQFLILTYIPLIIATLYFVFCYIAYISSEYGVTNKRVLVKVGFVRRSSLEIFFHKIESISADQGFIGRMLDYGTVIVSGTGGSKDPFCYVPHPLEFRRYVQEQMERSLQSSLRRGVSQEVLELREQ